MGKSHQVDTKIAYQTQLSLEAPFVLLEASGKPEQNVLLFEAPHQIIEAKTLNDVAPAFNEIELALASGYHVAGYMSYELGAALEPRLHHCLNDEPSTSMPNDTPLLWFGVFAEKTLTTPQALKDFLHQRIDEGEVTSALNQLRIAPRETFASYEKKFNTVKAAIEAGDIYQLNLTFKADVKSAANPLALYAGLRRNQPVAYAGLIMTGSRSILSASPELFIENRGGNLETRPMKGTLHRAPCPEQDKKLKAQLRGDEKSRAENLMIVDLMRNDLSRIAETGSVMVNDLFKVETYRSLHQMISVVTARQKPDQPLIDQMRALFPPGSITGAPKIRAMELINDLENESRGIYTGAIGYFAPGGDYCFNVAIRTLTLNADGSGEIGIGSGLVYDSNAKAEYDECLLKLQFLKHSEPDYKLLETIAYKKGEGLLFLDEHIERVARSARYFDIPLEVKNLTSLLQQFTKEANGSMRLRVLVTKSGDITINASELEPEKKDEVWLVDWAEQRMNPANTYLYHKTTHRQFYDEPRKQAIAKTPSLREVLFLNDQGEVTEGSFTNIFIRNDEELLTPRQQAGLLPGTLRQHLIKTGRAREVRLEKEDILNAKELYVGNSVRGLIRAKLV